MCVIPRPHTMGKLAKLCTKTGKNKISKKGPLHKQMLLYSVFSVKNQLGLRREVGYIIKSRDALCQKHQCTYKSMECQSGQKSSSITDYQKMKSEVLHRNPSPTTVFRKNIPSPFTIFKSTFVHRSFTVHRIQIATFITDFPSLKAVTCLLCKIQ